MAKFYGKHNLLEVVDKTVFFDANILIYLFWATGRKYQENGYASFYNALIKQNNILVVDFVVISEVVNRMIRTECNEQEYKYNKEFRNSEVGKNIISSVYEIVRFKIVNNFKIVGKAYEKSAIEDFLNINNLDFSDKAIVNICQENNFVLLTDDGDFANSDLEIISLNKKIQDLKNKKVRL